MEEHVWDDVKSVKRKIENDSDQHFRIVEQFLVLTILAGIGYQLDKVIEENFTFRLIWGFTLLYGIWYNSGRIVALIPDDIFCWIFKYKNPESSFVKLEFSYAYFVTRAIVSFTIVYLMNLIVKIMNIYDVFSTISTTSINYFNMFFIKLNGD